MTELLIFLDYLRVIKGVIKGRDEIRDPTLHTCGKKPLQSLWSEPKPPMTIRLTSWRLEWLCWEKSTVKHCPPKDYSHKASRKLCENLFRSDRKIKTHLFAWIYTNLSVLANISVLVWKGLSGEFTHSLNLNCSVEIFRGEKNVYFWSMHENRWTPRCWSVRGCLQTLGCWQRLTGFQQPRGAAL